VTRSTRLVVLSAALSVSAPAVLPAQTADERATARALVEKRQTAVVMVLATLKMRAPTGGRENARDVSVQANGTVLEPNGLTVLSLSALEPGSLLSGRGRGGEITSETADLRIRTADDRELPARVVLRDADLDLVYIRPVDPPTSPMASVDAPTSTPALLDLVIVLRRAPEVLGWKTYASFAYVQMATEKPQPYLLIGPGDSIAGGFGFPIFDAKGGFVGIMARIGGTRTLALPAVVPAEDIREIAKQATGR
jgi:hypothetical protein